MRSENGVSDEKFFEASKIGKLINGKHPINGSIKVDEKISSKNNDNDNKLYIYNYPLNIEYSSYEESISVLFVGQSGPGKSIFINAYAIHLLGIGWNDNIRYKPIFGDSKKEKDQTKSQTDDIITYYLTNLRYNNKLIKLIGTPGAGDTINEKEKQISDVEKDKMEKNF